MGRLKTLPSRLQAAPARLATATQSQRERLRGSAWIKIRARIMARDHGLCLSCQRQGKVTQATEVDHISEVADGGSDDDANLEAICHPCNEAKRRAFLKRRGGGG